MKNSTLAFPTTGISGKRPVFYSVSLYLLLALATPMSFSFAQAVDESVNACAEKLEKKFIEKGWIGITPEYDGDGAIIVVQVFANSPAEKSGILEGDLVTGINGQDREAEPEKFFEEYDSLRPNKVIVFNLEREGRRLSISVLVEPIPKAVLENWIQEECERLGLPGDTRD